MFRLNFDGTRVTERYLWTKENTRNEKRYIAKF